MATIGHERGIRYLLLLWEGGTLVLQEILATETDKTGDTFEALLKANERYFKHKTDKQTIQKIFPKTGTRDSKTWDISLLATVILKLFEKKLSVDICNDIRSLKELRNELAHIASLTMEEQEYDEDRKKLAAMLMKLSNGLDRTIHDKCQHYIKDFATGPIDINTATERMKDLCKYDELFSKQFETLTGKVDQVHDGVQDIKQMLRSMFQLEGEYSSFKVIGTEMVLRCPSSPLIKLAEESIIKVFKAALKRTDGEKDITKLALAVHAILSDIENCDGVVVSEIEKKCVRIIMKCKTCKGLLEILEYIEGERLQQRLLDLSSALDEMFDERFSITTEISKDSLEELLEMSKRVRDIFHQSDVANTSYITSLKHLSNDTDVETQDVPMQELMDFGDPLTGDVLKHEDIGNKTTPMAYDEFDVDTEENSFHKEIGLKIPIGSADITAMSFDMQSDLNSEEDDEEEDAPFIYEYISEVDQNGPWANNIYVYISLNMADK